MMIAVIDDCVRDRSRIIDGIRQYWCKTTKKPGVYSFENGESFLATMVPGKFELILLDCCMDGMDGIQTATMIRRIDYQAKLIFITTSQDYAIDGYLVAASGYLVKPFTYDQFAQTLSVALDGSGLQHDYIALPTIPFETKVILDHIVYCDINGHYTQVHLVSGDMLRVRMTFTQLNELLAVYTQFLESYRGCLINMAHIYEIEDMNFLMDSKERVPFRKKERKKLLQKYAEYLFDKVRLVHQ